MDRYGDEMGRRSETADEAGERARRLRAQAELAWARVQRVAQRGRTPASSMESIVTAAQRIPIAGYLAGIVGSLMASASLHAAGHQTVGRWVGLMAPLAFGVGLFLKTGQRQPR